jgi:hypothetical protein
MTVQATKKTATIKKSSEASLAYKAAGWLAYYAFMFWAGFRAAEASRSMFGWPGRSSFGELLVFLPAWIVAALIGCVLGSIIDYHRRQFLASKLRHARRPRKSPAEFHEVAGEIADS